MQFSNRDDEYVPLVSYVLVVASWWREIALGAVLAAVAAGALALLVEVLAPEYSASADVAVIDTSTTVSLDDSFQAAENVFLERRGGRESYLARRAALLGLIRSGSVAEAVARSIDWPDAGDPVKLTALIESVSAELVTIGVVTERNQSDLLRITLEADSAEKAVLGANAWATQYVMEVNRVFTPVTPSVVTSVQLRLEEAEGAYLKAQVELEKHLIENNIEKIQRRVEVMREDLEKIHEARGVLLSMHVDARTNQQAALLDERHATRRKLDTMLRDASSLLRHVRSGGESTVRTTSLAIQLLKFKLYGATENARVQLRLDNNIPLHEDAASLLIDVESLIDTMSMHLDEVNDEIQRQTMSIARQLAHLPSRGSLPSSTDPAGTDPEYSLSYLEPLANTLVASRSSYLESISTLESEIQDLEVQLENVSSRTKLLTQRRDLAYSNLETLQNEVVELQLTSAGSQSVVRIGAPAVAAESTRPSPIIFGAVLGAAMLPLSTFLVLFLNAMGIQPLLRRAGDEHQDSGATSPNPIPDRI